MLKRTLAALGLAIVAITAAPAHAGPGLTAECAGVYQGAPMQGVLAISRMYTAMRWEIRGRFFDPRRNMYEFEVLTPHAAGTGGLWINGARHRESHVYVQLTRLGFAIRLETGEVAEFRCA